MLKPFVLLILSIFFCAPLRAQLDGNTELIPASNVLYTQYLDEHKPLYGSQLALIIGTGKKIEEATKRFLIGNGKSALLHHIDWEFKLVKGDDVNLLVFPGGKVLVYDNLWSVVSNQLDLAWLMAHGMAHTLIDEGEENTVQSYGTGSKSDNGFTDFEELMADELGMKLMAIAGFSPSGVADFWENLSVSNAEYLEYHPDYIDKSMSLKMFARDARDVAKDFGVRLKDDF
ncbi:M48 family metalloprotease [Salegentibacter sp. F14]